MKTYNNTIIIGIDHGYGNIKTGIAAYDSEPLFTADMLTYDGKCYLFGEGHKEFVPNKIHLFTLMAIAKELKAENLTEANVDALRCFNRKIGVEIRLRSHQSLRQLLCTGVDQCKNSFTEVLGLLFAVTGTGKHDLAAVFDVGICLCEGNRFFIFRYFCKAESIRILTSVIHRCLHSGILKKDRQR